MYEVSLCDYCYDYRLYLGWDHCKIIFDENLDFISLTVVLFASILITIGLSFTPRLSYYIEESDPCSV